MPLLAAPSLIQLPDKGEYCINFSYNFQGDQGLYQPAYGGMPIVYGSRFELNSTTVQGVANLPRFNSLQVTCTFNTLDTNNVPDGPLYIYMPLGNQLIVLTPQIGNGANLNVAVCYASGCFPILQAQTLNIIFVKGANGTPELFGNLNVSLFTDRLPAYVTSGMAVA